MPAHCLPFLSSRIPPPPAEPHLRATGLTSQDTEAHWGRQCKSASKTAMCFLSAEQLTRCHTEKPRFNLSHHNSKATLHPLSQPKCHPLSAAHLLSFALSSWTQQRFHLEQPPTEGSRSEGYSRQTGTETPPPTPGPLCPKLQDNHWVRKPTSC